jgi:hypothetical protein
MVGRDTIYRICGAFFKKKHQKASKALDKKYRERVISTNPLKESGEAGLRAVPEIFARKLRG